MGKISQKSIKFNNCQAVLNSITESKDITRNDISTKCGLSIMTVGKIVDFLVEQGLVVEIKQAVNKAGRRAGRLNISHQKYFLFLDISTNELNCRTYNLLLDCISSDTKKISKKADRSVLFNEFLADKALQLINDNTIDNCIGVFIFKDISDNENLCSIAETFFPDSCVVLSDIFDLISANNKDTDRKATLYCSINKNRLNTLTSISDEGQNIEYRSDLGRLLVDEKSTYSELISGTDSVDVYTGLVSVLLFNIVSMQNITDIYFDVNSIFDNEIVYDDIKHKMDTLCEIRSILKPSISLLSRNQQLFNKGALRLIFNKWLIDNYDRI